MPAITWLTKPQASIWEIKLYSVRHQGKTSLLADDVVYIRTAQKARSCCYLSRDTSYGFGWHWKTSLLTDSGYRTMQYKLSYFGLVTCEMSAVRSITVMTMGAAAASYPFPTGYISPKIT
jgi:hypothetical protein